MGLAERFMQNTNKSPVLKEIKPVKSLMSDNFLEKPKLEQLKEELFEKIVSIPCWFEYDQKTQYDLIIKFLNTKNIKTPEVFAKVLQHSILGFGIFDEYLLKKDVTAVFYEEGEPLLYTQNGKNVVDNIILPMSKVWFAVQNIINMSQYSVKNGFFSYRISDYWVQLKSVPHSKIKLSISKVTEEFLAHEAEKANLSLLLSDF